MTQLLDFMVWERAAARYPDPSDLASFQGVFGAIINVVERASSWSTLGGWMLTRFGLGVGLAANPARRAGRCCAATGDRGVPRSGRRRFVFFVLVCAQQVADITLTDGTTRTSINATYQALLPRVRLRRRR